MLILFALACADAPPPSPPPAAAPAPSAPVASKKAEVATPRQINAAGLRADLDAKKVPLLIDVRTAKEFATGHVPGAKSVPIDELADRTAELTAYKAGAVYVICASGGRSARGAAMLASQGYDAVNVTDGTAAWVAAGNPVEQ